jgi:hypothetical protein
VESHLEKIDFVSLPTAPTLDEIIKAIENGSMVASQNVTELFKKAFSHKQHLPLEQFNFGPMPIEVLRDAQEESMDFLDAGLFKPPYDFCLYRCSIRFKATTIGTTLLVVQGDETDKEPGVATVMFSHSREHMIAMYSINMMRTRLNWRDGKRSVELQLPQEEYKFWHDSMRAEDGSEITLHEACEGSMCMLGLTMILNTKGVRKERVEPPRKPNQARLRAGKPLIPYVTRVYTDVYLKAVEPGIGTHASPRPHRRRAHVRRIPARNNREAYSIGIDAMLVNWDGQPLTPHQYEVKT